MSKSTKSFIEQNNQFIDGGTDTMYWKLNVGGDIDWMGVPNSKATIDRVKSKNSLTYPGALVYEATYNFDENGIRYTPSNNIIGKKYSLFFGDSQTFGEGLNDDETLPFLFQKHSGNFNSFNFGFPGACPTNMLGWLKEEKVQSKFKDVEGEVFYIIRDGDIRNVNKLEESITPNEFKKEHFKNLSNIFKESNEIVKKISSKLNLTVTILPLTFSYREIIGALSNLDIKLLNFYFTDLGYLTNNYSRFLDGAHTFKSNNILAKLISDNYTKSYNPINLFDSKPIDSIEELNQRTEIESFFMHYFSDYPKDDAGVLIANNLKFFSQKIKQERLFQLSEKKFYEKIKLIDILLEKNILPSNTYKLFLENKLQVDKEELFQETNFKSLPEEYKSIFLKIYVDIYH